MGISIWQLVIVLLIVVMLFGSKRLRTLGSDLGGAIGGFRKSMSDNPAATLEESRKQSGQ
jgi:sec-independent protein translocase protein TatA